MFRLIIVTMLLRKSFLCNAFHINGGTVNLARLGRQLMQPQMRYLRTRRRPVECSISERSAAQISAELESKVGGVNIRNTQRTYNIDKVKLKRDIEAAMAYLGVSKWDCSLWLTNDTTVRRLNKEYRGMNKSTDILSFGMAEVDGPENLLPVLSPDFMELGEMIVSLPYVDRQCKRDLEEVELSKKEGFKLEEEGGISGAMANVYTVQERLPLLCIHGLLHLLGHDHETDEDYEIMKKREEDVLEALGLAKQ